MLLEGISRRSPAGRVPCSSKPNNLFLLPPQLPHPLFATWPNAIFMNRNNAAEDTAAKNISAGKKHQDYHSCYSNSFVRSGGPEGCWPGQSFLRDTMCRQQPQQASLLSVCCDTAPPPPPPAVWPLRPHQPLECALASGSWYFWDQEGRHLQPSSFIPCQRSVVFQDSKFFFATWMAIHMGPGLTDKVSSLSKGEPPSRTPPTSRPPAILARGSEICFPSSSGPWGTPLWPRNCNPEEAFLQVCLQIWVYREK